MASIPPAEQITRKRMDHLWRMSHAVVGVAPQLAMHYQETLHRIALAERQTIADAAERRCCARCTVPQVPALTCQVSVAGDRCSTSHKPTATPDRYIVRNSSSGGGSKSTALVGGRSVRSVDVRCQVCGSLTRYGGASREELRQVSGDQRRVRPLSKKARSRRRPATANAAPLTSSVAASPVSLPDTQVKPMFSRKLGDRAASAPPLPSSRSANATASTSAASTPSAKTIGPPGDKRDKKKSGKKHALGKLLDKRKQQASDAHTKDSVSLSDFLMDLGP